MQGIDVQSVFNFNICLSVMRQEISVADDSKYLMIPNAPSIFISGNMVLIVDSIKSKLKDLSQLRLPLALLCK